MSQVVDVAAVLTDSRPVPSVDSDVALWKEAAVEGALPRVVADAHLYIIYSLKNRAVLRLLARASNQQSTIKLHSSDVSMVKFVNYKSNVVASCGEDDDFFVWFVSKGADDKPDATVYFRLKNASDLSLKIRSFSWFVDPATNSPNILMTVNNGCSVLNCGRTISAYTNAPSTVSFQDSSKSLERTVADGVRAFTCVGADGIFAFNTDSTTVVTCTTRNTNTPAWKPTSGEEIVGLEMLQTRSAVLVAASAACVWVWDVAVEPQPIRRLSFGAAGVRALAAAALSFAVFTPTKLAYVVEALQPGEAGGPLVAGLLAEKFELSKQVSPQCLSPSVAPGAGSFVITADFGDRLAILVMKKTNQVDVLGRSAPFGAAPVASPAAVVTSSPNGSPFVPPPPSRRDTQPNLAIPLPPPYGGAASFATPVASPIVAGSPFLPAPSRALLNPALPQLSQDGVIAQTLEETSREVQAAKERVDSALQNTAQILGLTAMNVKKDHAALTSLSLEAQMTELQRAGVGSAAPTNPAASAAASALFEQKFVNTLLEQVASTIIDGLVPGVRSAILEELEPGIRAVVAKQWKKSNRDVFKARVDALLKDSATAFIAELETKQKAYEKNLEFYAKEVKRTAEGGLQKLSSQIIVLEDQLNAISQSRILDEVRDLRRQVKELKAQIAAGASAAPADIPPTTLVANAKQMIAAGDVSQGLDYIVRVQQPEVTMALLAELDSEELHNTVCENMGVPDRVWAEVLSHCAHATKINRLALVLGWIRDVLADHSNVLQSGALKSALQTFTISWKPQVAQDRDLTQKLKQIERAVN